MYHLAQTEKRTALGILVLAACGLGLLGAMSAAAQGLPSSDPLIEYRFAASDISGNQVANVGATSSHAGTLGGNAAFVGTGGDLVLDLDGSVAFLEATDSRNISFAQGVAVAARVRRLSNVGEDAIVGKWYGPDQWLLTFYAGGQHGQGRLIWTVFFDNGGSGSIEHSLPDSSYLGNWHDIAAVYDPDSGSRLYWDGQLVGTDGNTGGAVRAGNRPIRVGDAGPPWSTFHGQIDDLRIWADLSGSASLSGHITAQCGFGVPLPSGHVGSSPTGTCEGVCVSQWSDGFCSDPADAGSRLEVYGCAGKTSGSGYSCDGETNGGVLIGVYDSGEQVAFSDLWHDTQWCTLQLDVLRPGGGDPIGLRDFLVWERDDCGGGPPPDPQPDLEPTAILFDLDDLVAGRGVFFDSGVRNNGGADSGTFEVQWRVDGALAEAGTHGSVAATTTVLDGNSDFNWTATPGVHEITFIVDAGDQIAESDEGNNEISVIVEVLQADLEPTPISFSPAEPVVGDSVFFDSGVRNLGGSDSGPFRVLWLVDGVVEAGADHGNVAAGATVLDGNSAFTWTAAAGWHDVTFLVDSSDGVDESDEDNNAITISLYVGQADLEPTTISVSPSSPTVGDPVLFEAGVGNFGDAPSGPFSVRWTIDGQELARHFHDDIAAGEIDAGSSSAAWTATAGTHTVTFEVDVEDEVDEGDEGNNLVSVTFEVSGNGASDLEPIDMQFDAADLVAGGTVLFDPAIRNNDDVGTGNFNIEWWVDGRSVAAGGHNGVPGGTVVDDGNSQFLWVATEGTHEITFVVDSDDFIAESDETNNRLSVVVTVGPGSGGEDCLRQFLEQVEILEQYYSQAEVVGMIFRIFEPEGFWDEAAPATAMYGPFLDGSGLQIPSCISHPTSQQCDATRRALERILFISECSRSIGCLSTTAKRYEIPERSTPINMGHVFAGLSELYFPGVSLPFFAVSATVGGYGLDARTRTYIGDVGVVAQNVANGAGPLEDEIGRGLLLKYDLHADVDAFVLRRLLSNDPNLLISEALRDYYTLDNLDYSTRFVRFQLDEIDDLLDVADQVRAFAILGEVNDLYAGLGDCARNLPACVANLAIFFVVLDGADLPWRSTVELWEWVNCFSMEELNQGPCVTPAFPSDPTPMVTLGASVGGGPAEPSLVVPSGQPFDVTWSSTGASICRAYTYTETLGFVAAWDETKTPNGSDVVTLSDVGTYTLSLDCFPPDDLSSDRAEISVEVVPADAPLPIVPLGGDAFSLALGGLEFLFLATPTTSDLTVVQRQRAPPAGPGDPYFLLRHWEISSSLEPGTFEVEITFPYSDQQLADVGLSEHSLQVFFLDESDLTWQQADLLSHDLAENRLTIASDHFSLWALGSSFEPTLTAAFDAGPGAGLVPLTVAFTDLSQAEGTAITSWSWDFDGDGRSDSTEPNPDHTYTSAGRYDVVLTVSNGVQNDSVRQVGLIEVGEGSTDEGLVARWPLDEGTGALAFDVSADQRVGELTGDPKWKFLCQAGGCLAFDGIDDHVVAIDSSADSELDLGTGLSMSVWVLPTDLGATQSLLSKDDAYELEIGWVAPEAYSLRLGNITLGAGATPLEAHRWQHLAATWDGETVRYYYNGHPDGSVSFSQAITANDHPLGIGARPSPPFNGGTTFAFSGRLDEVRLYDRALSSAEVGALSALAGSGEIPDLRPPRLLAAAPMGLQDPPTHQVELALETDEPALCRYAQLPGVPFDAMQDMEVSGSLLHRSLLGDLAMDQIYALYVRCRDLLGNLQSDERRLLYAISDQSDLLTGLEARWALDEGTGCLAADSARSNHGTLGPVCPQTAPQWTDGVRGSALAFDPVDAAEVRIPGSSLPDASSGLTLAAWVRHSPVAGFRAILDRRSAATVGYDLYIDAASRPFLRLDELTLSGEQVIADGAWHHVVATYDGWHMSLYVDGQLDRSAAVGVASGASDADLRLGRHWTSTDFPFEGTLDEVRIYDRALSQIEVLDLFSLDSR